MAELAYLLPGLLLATLAGLSTTFGAFIVFLVKNPGKKYLGATLGFSAGVMIAVSFVELLPSSIETSGFLLATVAFLAGIVVVMMVDFIIPHSYKSEVHEGHLPMTSVSSELNDSSNRDLFRVGTLTAIGIFLHNLPEGFVTLAGSLESLSHGFLLFIAISIHNIPEGISVAVPIHASTGNARKAFLWSFLSGAAEPVGAIVAVFILLPFLLLANPLVSLSLAFVAGIMVFISVDELLPAAREYGEDHITAGSFVLGLAVMMGTLFLFSNLPS